MSTMLAGRWLIIISTPYRPPANSWGGSPDLGRTAALFTLVCATGVFFLFFALFYEIIAGEVVMRRAMHGQRDIPRRLLESPK